MRTYLLISMLAVATTLSVQARADQKSIEAKEDPRKAEASALFEEGSRLSSSGRVAEALDTYEKAYATYPSPNTLLNIARCEQALGKKLKALRHYREALRNPLLSPRGAEYAKMYIVELTPSFARINVNGPNGMVVALGNENVTLPLPEPLDVEPGTFAATGVMNGQRYNGSVTAEAGKVVTMVMKSLRAESESLSESREEHNNTRYIVSGSLAALGIVGVGLGIGFTAAANHASNDGAKVSSTLGASTSACPGNDACSTLAGKVDSKMRNSNIAVGSYITGGVLIAAGVATYFAWPMLTKKESASVMPWIGKEGAGLSYGKEF